MNVRKRLKWEPVALMVLVLGLGLWIAFGPASKPKFPIATDALTQEVRIGNTRGVLEASKTIGVGGDYGFRFWMKDGPNPPGVLTRADAAAFFGAPLLDETVAPSQSWVLRTWVFRTLNITSWTSMVWIGIGLLGQVAFSGRMLLQWLVSERSRKSVITESFWWFSLFGGLMLFSYFVWRADPIGILGQAFGLVIYIRNIRLLRKHARRTARDSVQ
jgi:lipid-A-disaccharide synthase-like uncharacterized protein